ncbi:hypothetical protein AK812_SmicGene7398 [Symbiodinium microadriaticum]|uniref:Uncharacterized protein n=1 Tax=Symbiodinium microadriaticum TaxID=2951 RepID=A0A1Q9ENT2_SYMMI|nr:hypothetical protein AK812_SmicGene7398 [Symbiodinium microadriaticum]
MKVLGDAECEPRQALSADEDVARSLEGYRREEGSGQLGVKGGSLCRSLCSEWKNGWQVAFLQQTLAERRETEDELRSELRRQKIEAGAELLPKRGGFLRPVLGQGTLLETVGPWVLGKVKSPAFCSISASKAGDVRVPEGHRSVQPVEDQLVNFCCPNAVWERVAASTGAPYHNLETFVGPSKAMTKLVNKTYE